MTLITCDNCTNQITGDDRRLKNWVFKVIRKAPGDQGKGHHTMRDICEECVDKWFGSGQRKFEGKDGFMYYFITRSNQGD